MSQVEYNEAQRMANMGVDCVTKKLGTIRVKELPLESIIEFGGDLNNLMSEIMPGLDEVAVKTGRKTEEPSEEGSVRGIEFLGRLISNPTTFSLLRKVAAASCERQPEDFEKMGITDWLKWLKAFKTVTDWEELKELFFELVPVAALKELKKSMTTP